MPGNGTTDAPPAGVIPIPYSSAETTAGFRVAIFDGNNTQTQVNSPLGYATPVGAAFPGLYQYTFTSPLADGVHNIVAEVQMIDPAKATETGFGTQSTALQITVDTVVPPVFFGATTMANDGLASDSGVQGYPLTNTDNVTNDTTPTFWGVAEANAIIRVYDNVNGNPADYVLLGTTVAVPDDGTNVFPGGQWNLTSTVDLNNPAYFPHDGVRNLLVTAEDLAGNVSAPDALTIFIDTQGPQISNVQVNSTTSTYNLFGLKPTNALQGPTPLVNSLMISVVDNPDRDTADFPNYLALLIPTPVVTMTSGGSGYTSAPTVTFSGGGATTQATGIAIIVNGMVTGVEIESTGSGYASAPTVSFSGGGFITPATATAALHSPGNFVLTGDANGIIPIKSVVITDNPIVNGQPATATIQLVFYSPLPDDRYTLTIDASSVVDPAGNELDGESNAAQPNGAPSFPSGNGIPGGNFVARFTVNSRPEIGTWSGGSEYIDTNGNGVWDPTNADASNRDITYSLGLASDKIFAGNFGTAYTGSTADGFSKLAAYGKVGSTYRWLFTNDAGQLVKYQVESSGLAGPNGINGLPVAGNFSDKKALGDQVGLFDGKNWYLDVNGDGVLDTVVHSKIFGYPIVGDFNGDGLTDLGTYQNGVFYFQLGTGPGKFSTTVLTIKVSGVPGFGFQLGANSRPVAADMNKDGVTDIGLYVPDGAGPTGTESSEWYWLVSASGTPTPGKVTALAKAASAYSDTPLGTDLYYQFGNTYAMPIVGNFDPPINRAVPRRLPR